jgi:hypothetical protein
MMLGLILSLLAAASTPPVTAYEPCQTDAECGDIEYCVLTGASGNTCAPLCTSDEDCPANPSGEGTPVCDILPCDEEGGCMGLCLLESAPS